MAKYVFLLHPAHGHVNPTLAVAQELIRRGEQVVYYLTEEFQATIEGTAATFHSYQPTMSKQQSPSEPPMSPSVFLHVMLHRMVSESQQLIPQVLEPIRAEQADVILYDGLAMCARIVAQVLHVPGILL